MKVLLVDDHPLILAALQSVIEGFGDGTEVVAVDAADKAQAALAAADDFDLVLLDLSLGDIDGFEVLADMRQRYPGLPVVVISATERHADVIRALDMGAMGFVPKRTSNRGLVEALALVMAGGVYIPPVMLGMSVAPQAGADALMGAAPGSIADMSRVELAQTESHRTPPSIESIGLTPRQSEVMALLLKGLPNKLIARELKLSVETVKDHVAAVLQALHVSSRTQAVLVVSQMSQASQAGGGSVYSTHRPAPR